MLKKTKAILLTASLAALCAGLCACSDGDDKKTELDKYRDEGYKVSVTYDSNGGSILSGENTTLVDMFNPSTRTPDENGVVHIKLMDPTDPAHHPGNPITVTFTGYSFVGWYRSRTLRKDERGNVVDEEGNPLQEHNGKYGVQKQVVETDPVTGQDKEVLKFIEVRPAYDYAGPWNFETDTIAYSEEEYRETDGVCNVTLYAAWVPYYTFEYYYMKEDEWTMFGSTYFDYVTVNASEETTKDTDTLWIPQWDTTGSSKGGAIVHEHVYDAVKNYSYKFPSLAGHTFKKAYADEACTQEITDSFKHPGTLDYATATATGPVQKIYVEFDEGSYYRIYNARQMSENGDPEGIYTVYNDLDFNPGREDPSTHEVTYEQLPWTYCNSEFTGKILSSDASVRTFRNIKASFSRRETGTQGKDLFAGIFGSIGAGAEITNVVFESATLEVREAATLKYFYCGLLAGNINEEAHLSGVTVSGTVKYYVFDITSGSRCVLNLLANGKTEGVTQGSISLYICGTRSITGNDYIYYIDPDTVTVKPNGDITVETKITGVVKPLESYEIQVQ